MNRSDEAGRDSAPEGGLMGSFLGAAHALEARLEEGLASVGLSRAKYGVLETLVRAGAPLALSELAAAQQCVRSNMTQLVDRLQADGSVQRVDDPNDRRSVRAVLTPLGKERQVEGAKKIAQVRDEFSASLGPADRAVLSRLLESLG